MKEKFIEPGIYTVDCSYNSGYGILTIVDGKHKGKKVLFSDEFSKHIESLEAPGNAQQQVQADSAGKPHSLT